MFYDSDGGILFTRNEQTLKFRLDINSACLPPIRDLIQGHFSPRHIEYDSITLVALWRRLELRPSSSHLLQGAEGKGHPGGSQRMQEETEAGQGAIQSPVRHECLSMCHHEGNTCRRIIQVRLRDTPHILRELIPV